MKKFLAILILFAVISCKKKNKNVANDHPVANVAVNISLYPNDPLNFKIQGVGGWKYVDGGVNGIIVYRRSEEEFFAVDRTSTYHTDKPEAKVFVMSDNFTLRDSISDSRWRIFDGTVTKGPAEWPLKTYGTSYDGNLLRIFN